VIAVAGQSVVGVRLELISKSVKSAFELPGVFELAQLDLVEEVGVVSVWGLHEDASARGEGVSSKGVLHAVDFNACVVEAKADFIEKLIVWI